MLKLSLFIFLSAKFIAFISANQQAAVSTDASVPHYTSEDAAIYAGFQRYFGANNGLASECLYNLLRTQGKKNLITSIYSFLLSLGQFTAYANEQTRAELLQVQHLNSVNEVQTIASAVSSKLNLHNLTLTNNTSSLLSLMVADNKYEFTDDFSETFDSMVNGKTANLNFRESCATADYVNNWMKQEDTCNQDHDFLSSKQMSEDLGLIIASFIHLTLNWDSSFKPIKKVPIDFWESDNIVKSIDALYIDGSAKYSEDKDLKAELIDAALSGGWRLLIVYPNEGVELFDILYKFYTSDILNSVFAKTELAHLKLTVPLDEEICGYEDYVDGMKTANLLTEILDPKFNGFSGGFEDGVGCHVSHMFHKMHLTLVGGLDTEEVPESSYDEYSDYNEINLEINRPYIFYVICPNNTQVFSGTVYQPN